jgi:2-phospho-L-lactate guanylyltransferase
MSRWTIIPVRGLASGKSRLSSTLDAHARQALNRLLLQTVLEAVAGAEGGLSRCIVASGTDDASQLARLHGAHVLCDTGRGDLNAALEATRHRALLGGATSILALVADLPYASEAALARLFAAVPAGTAALVPDKQGVGTTGLLLPAQCQIKYMFGQNSLARHRHALREQHMQPIEWDDPALAFDLDTPADYLLWQARTSLRSVSASATGVAPVLGFAPGAERKLV